VTAALGDGREAELVEHRHDVLARHPFQLRHGAVPSPRL
jgi:hypothetical protein